MWALAPIVLTTLPVALTLLGELESGALSAPWARSDGDDAAGGGALLVWVCEKLGPVFDALAVIISWFRAMVAGAEVSPRRAATAPPASASPWRLGSGAAPCVVRALEVSSPSESGAVASPDAGFDG